MNLTKSLISFASVGALLVSAAPASLAATVPTVAASQARCQQVTGSEKSRCLAILRRSNRLKFEAINQKVSGRGNTLTEQRVITQHKSIGNVQAMAGQDLRGLRMNSSNGIAARRTIRTNASNAREMCKDIVKSMDRAVCTRKNLEMINRGIGAPGMGTSTGQ